MIKVIKKPATKFGDEFRIGANTLPPVYSLNTEAPEKSAIKPKDFDGVHPEPWDSDSSITNPPTNRTNDFNDYMGSESIPVVGSLTGTA